MSARLSRFRGHRALLDAQEFLSFAPRSPVLDDNPIYSAASCQRREPPGILNAFSGAVQPLFAHDLCSLVVRGLVFCAVLSSLAEFLRLGTFDCQVLKKCQFKQQESVLCNRPIIPRPPQKNAAPFIIPGTALSFHHTRAGGHEFNMAIC